MTKGLAAAVWALAAMAAMAPGAEPAQARRVGRGALAARAGAANVTFKLPNVIGDNMVLQRDVPLPIWGWAVPGQKVSVTLAGANVEALADELGEWMVSLPPMKAGGPYEMTVSAPRSPAITVKNILVGEVWFSSGQSNMDVPVVGAQDGQAQVAAADWPEIR
ncbi:MAG: hypothetical protein NT031_15540, partial [Planctomycetota bacterium]|nr:hypothetical protein [Planctomycetota bacterium]